MDCHLVLLRMITKNSSNPKLVSILVSLYNLMTES